MKANSILFALVVVIIATVFIGSLYEPPGQATKLKLINQKQQKKDSALDKFINELRKEAKAARENGDKEDAAALESLASRLKDAPKESSRNFSVAFSWKPRVFGEGNEMSEFAGRMLDALEEDLEQCLKEFRCDQKPPLIPVIIIESKEEFEKIVSALGISPETSAIYISQYGIIMFRVEGFSINDLYHEMSHAVTNQKKRELGLRTDQRHWSIEEGLAVNREKGMEKIIHSLYVHFLNYGTNRSPEKLIQTITPPSVSSEENIQLFSDLYAQSGSLITFLLENGVSHEDLLKLGSELINAPVERREVIVKEFLKKMGFSLDIFYNVWLQWQKDKVESLRKELKEFERKEIEGQERRRKELGNKMTDEIIKDMKEAIRRIAE